MARLEDIAQVLGISKSTVSKALSGAGDVSDTMRRSVVETAVELGYSRVRRNEQAPRLAVFITNMDYAQSDDFGYDILVGFRKMAEPAGYQVCIIDLDHELENSIGYDAYMMRNNYRGGLFLGLSLDDPWLQDFKTCKTPSVLYDNHVSGNPNVTYVGVDNPEALDYAVQYLKGLHHEKIGYLSSALGAYVYQQRFQAFLTALRENGVQGGESLALNSYFTDINLKKHLPALLDQGCTAIICSHDVLAKAVLEECSRTGIRVPEELSIMGFDDLPLCKTTEPPLTTIRQDRTELGKSAYCALSSQLEGVPLSTFLLHSRIIERESCAVLQTKV